ncbi:PolC-type DNA polymerase III [Sulfoacidibacillus thermotolerans]|uniref:DNA polymerase III PolC-type n=1 Tax=Sulfoacidibacillus thermotolerans TaxID=1765684 RepID=A0A2U3DAC5_SULT2|nr:PolC-type DNA polymerase III [Sulfoacidibacillus thermotolerans]PWI58215.1 PolC-type DNA polymerase III [Sulfoacidibacillus thermotolerans]
MTQESSDAVVERAETPKEDHGFFPLLVKEVADRVRVDQRSLDAIVPFVRNVNIKGTDRRVHVVLEPNCALSVFELVSAWAFLQGRVPEATVLMEYADLDAGAVQLAPWEEVQSKSIATESIDYGVSLALAVWMLMEREPALRGELQQVEWRLSGDRKIQLRVAGSIKLLRARQVDQKLADLLCVLLRVQSFTVELCTDTDEEQRVVQFRQEIEQQDWDVLRQQVTVDKESSGQTAQCIEYGQAILEPAISIALIQDEMRRVVVEGRLFAVEWRDLANGRRLCQFYLTDEKDSITCKMFSRGGKKELPLPSVKDGMYVRVRGSVQYDTYSKELVLQVNDLIEYEPARERDEAEEKRVELHAHTQMSALDGVVSAGDLVAAAKAYGHSAIAITDHGVVQAYPEAYAAAKKHEIKVLYGVEINLIDIGQTIVYQMQDTPLSEDTIYVVFDTETTGLSAAEHELIEIAGVKMRRGEVIDTFAELIAPANPIPEKITEITNITNEMVAGKPTVDIVLPKFQAFCEGAILVAHNAEFDLSFLSVQAAKLGLPPFSQSTIDTLALARTLLPTDRNHRLKTLTQKYHVTLTQHHRALADAEATGKVFYKLLEEAQHISSVRNLSDLSALGAKGGDFARSRAYHATVLVQTQQGLRNLYRLISAAHVDYFYREPRTPRQLLKQYRKGLLIGSGCKYGEVFQALLRGKTDQELRALLEFYDFIELQPLDHYGALIESGEVGSYEVVAQYHKRLLALADELQKPVVATGDVHFLRDQDAIYREIIMHSAPGRKDVKPGVKQPPLTFRTTQQMLDAFSHLGARAKEIVVSNSRKIAEQIETVFPLPNQVYPPNMEGADEQVRSLALAKAHRLYGDPLPQVVDERLQKELHSIITHGFAVNYLIAHKLVTKSLEDGYIVGSRGSVGSSLVATMLDITEVNPLPPHYLCETCQTSEFILDGSIGSGFDLPDKLCATCQQPMKKDGQDIPFETFLGFKGDKVPDIDLNFSGEYQARAHKYTEELFGAEYVYRAGTISTIAEKTAFGYVKKWAEDRGKVLRTAEMQRLVAGCTGIKRTTGQHPGGLIIVPNDHEIYDFCPIQYPADDRTAEMRTTHFDFHAIHDNLLKLDILGHDDPTVLRMLQDMTGIDVRQVPVDDPKVYALFCGTESLGVSPQAIRSQTGTYGIPEFGTKFVRQMLEDTKPSTFADLVRISGLSHGTDVWLNNAQELIRQRTAPLNQVICCRDDIMVYLIYRGLDPSRAFKIMESVRKGKGLTEEDAEYMRSFEVPDWYMDSCRKIKYMFPKAHAAAYVLNAVRIAYFKVYEPLSFYAAYFTVRAEDFELEIMARGADAIWQRLEEVEEKGVHATPKEKSLQTVLEVALEMTRRGFKFHPIDLYQSDATRFLVRDNGLLPPFTAASGIGEAAARNIVAAREMGPFLSVEDLIDRARISKNVIELLQHFGCLEGLPESNQLTLF